MHLALATTQKGNMYVVEYVGKMQALGDEMATTGRPLDDAELVEYILTSLDLDFNPIISTLVAGTESVSVSELYVQLLAIETRMKLMAGGGSSANMANRGGRGGRGRGFGRSRGDGCGRGNGDNNSNNNYVPTLSAKAATSAMATTAATTTLPQTLHVKCASR